MAKFTKLYESEKFKKLSPSDQSIVRDRYFETKIAPVAKERGIDVGKAQQAFNNKFDISQNIAGRIKGAAGEALSTLQSKIDNHINDIDRDTDVNDIVFRGKLSRMSGAKEQANFLNMKLGKENWGVGNRGDADYAITTKKGMEILGMGDKWKGKPVAIDSDRVTRSDFFGDMQSGVLPVAGAIAGGVMTGGAGFIPAMAAAGAGGALGTGVRELFQPKKYQLQTGKEIGKDMLTEGALAMGGEGIGRMLRPLGRALLGPNRRRPFTMFGKQPQAKSVVDPTRRKLALKALEKDVVMPISNATGKQKLLGFAQRMGNTILGNPRAEKNAIAIANEAERLAGSKIGSQPGMSRQAVGEMIQRGVQGKITKLGKDLTKSESGFKKTLKNVIYKMRGTKKAHDPKVDEQIRNTVVKAHRDFMDEASGKYKDINATLRKYNVGEVMSTKGVKRAARKMLRDVPDAKVKINGEEYLTGKKIGLEIEGQKSLHTIIEDLGDHMSIEEAMWLRKVFGRHAYSKDLGSDIPNYMAGQMKGAIDRTFSRFAKNFSDSRNGQFLPEDLRTLVAKDLKDVNKFYSQGSKEFDDYLVRKIGKDLSEKGAVQPSEIVTTLANMPSERVGNLMNIIRKKGKKGLVDKVQTRYFDDVVWQGAMVGDDLVSPKVMLSNIQKMKSGTLQKIYGESRAKEIESLAKDLFRYADDNIGVDSLGKGDVADAIRGVVDAQKAQREYLSRNFVSIAEKGKNIGGSEYAKIIDMSMKDSGKAKELLSLIEEGSPAHGQMRHTVIQKMVNTLEDNLTDPTQALLNGDGLAKAMNQYMSANLKHGDNPLRILLGKEMFGDLKDLAKIAQMTVTKGNSGLVAMNIALNPFQNIGRLAEVNILSKLLNKPGFIKWMVKGSKGKVRRRWGDVVTRAAIQTDVGYIQDALEDVSFGDELSEAIGQ